MTEVEKVAAMRAGRPVYQVQQADTSTKFEKEFSLRDARLDDLNWQSEPTKDMIFRFLEILAICNSVITEVSDDPNTINYISESPDEAAFVVAAKRLGVCLLECSEMSIQLKLLKKGGDPIIKKYERLNSIEFTSVRYLWLLTPFLWIDVTLYNVLSGLVLKSFSCAGSECL
jgi:phospholipid-translocating ATPase